MLACLFCHNGRAEREATILLSALTRNVQGDNGVGFSSLLHVSEVADAQLYRFLRVSPQQLQPREPLKDDLRLSSLTANTCPQS